MDSGSSTFACSSNVHPSISSLLSSTTDRAAQKFDLLCFSASRAGANCNEMLALYVGTTKQPHE